MTDTLFFTALSFKLWLIPQGMTAWVTDKMSRCYYFQERVGSNKICFNLSHSPEFKPSGLTLLAATIQLSAVWGEQSLWNAVRGVMKNTPWPLCYISCAHWCNILDLINTLQEPQYMHGNKRIFGHVKYCKKIEFIRQMAKPVVWRTTKQEDLQWAQNSFNWIPAIVNALLFHWRATIWEGH